MKIIHTFKKLYAHVLFWLGLYHLLINFFVKFQVANSNIQYSTHRTHYIDIYKLTKCKP